MNSTFIDLLSSEQLKMVVKFYFPNSQTNVNQEELKGYLAQKNLQNSKIFMEQTARRAAAAAAAAATTTTTI